MERVVPWAILLSVFLHHPARAWRLVTIQYVADDRKTFTTRTLPGEDRLLGRKGTFTVDHVSVVAKTIEVGEESTRWQVVEPQANVSFEQQQIVTFNPSTEEVWPALNSPPRAPLPQKRPDPGQYTDDRALELLFEKKLARPRPPLRQGMRLRLHQALGVEESISGTLGPLQGERFQWQGEYSYFWQLRPQITLDLGLRLDREVNQFSLLTTTSTRQYLTLGSSFYSHNLLPWDALSCYLGVAMGLGYSSTRVNLFVQSGPSFVAPHVRAGVDWQFSPRWGLSLESGVESIFSREKTRAGPQQKSGQVNAKIALGLNYTFSLESARPAPPQESQESQETQALQELEQELPPLPLGGDEGEGEDEIEIEVEDEPLREEYF